MPSGLRAGGRGGVSIVNALGAGSMSAHAARMRAVGHPTMTMKLPKKATTVPSKRVWNSGLHARLQKVRSG